MESSYNSDESHNAGQNCMSCHTQNGSGEGVFTIAGTVYQADLVTPYPNCEIILYKTNLADIIYSLEVDVYGNFYTTETIDLNQACLPAVTHNSSTTQMKNSTTSGNCNGCHGISTERIYLE